MPNEWWGRLGLEEPVEGANDPSGNAAADPTSATEGAKEPDANADAGMNGQQNNTSDDPNGQGNPAQEGQTDPQGQPAKEGQAASNTSAAGTEPSGAAQEPQKQDQTAAERHANAERRRQEAEAKMRDKVTEDVLKQLNLRDPYNDNKPVTTIEEYRKYQQNAAAAKLQREIKSGTMSMETLEEAMLASPTIRNIVNGAGAEAAAAQEAQEQARQAQYQADMQRQIAEIQRINPQIKSINDVIAMPTGVVFAGFIRKGLTPVEAYKLANHDTIVSSARTAAEQAARNSAAGKAHLEQTKANNPQGFEVTQAMRDKYHRFAPNATDAEIAAAEKIARGK